MSTTISGYHNTLQNLNPSNPSVVITGTIKAAGTLPGSLQGYGAVYGTASTDFTITNLGLVDDTLATKDGTIEAGIVLGGIGTVINQGTVVAGKGSAVYLNAGGAVFNTGTVLGDELGIALGISGSNTVINSGLVVASAQKYTSKDGSVTYLAGGIVSDGAGFVENNVGGTVVAPTGDGIFLYALEPDAATNTDTLVAGTLINAGTIKSAYGALFNAIGTFSNSGKIFATGIGTQIFANTTLDNTGTILGGHAGVIAYGASSIINTSTIDSTLNSNFTVGNSVYGTLVLAPTGIVLRDGGSISNAAGGIIASTYGDGVDLNIGGGLSNAGNITGKLAGVVGGANTTIANTGTIAGSGGVAVSLTGTGDRVIDNPGAVFTGLVEDSNGSGTLELAAGGKTGTIAAASQFIGFTTIDVDAGAVWNFAGATSISSNVVNNGSIFETAADALTIGGNVSGGGVIILDPTTLTLNGSVTGQQISFAGAGDMLDLGDAPGFHGTVSGFGTSNSIILTDIASFTSETFANGVLDINGPSGAVAITFANPITFPDFLKVTSSGGETVINEVTCFAAGTRIATPAGEVAVEALQAGDWVRTQYAGNQQIKWIGHRSYEGRFIQGNRAALPICIRQHAIADNVPARDLWVSPGHAISIDGVLIHAGRLVNGVSILQAAQVETVSYFHIELENHEIIFAENCPAETFMDEHFRRQFQNAAEFHRLYPGAVAPLAACQPRLEHGFHLHAIQTRINARAGISPPVVAGPLRGFIDQAGGGLCFGWAQNMAAPEAPVCLDIRADGRLLGRVLANLYRKDVEEAGFGSGYQGFEFKLPPGVTGAIEVCRSADLERLGHAAPELRQAS